jgi:hypothetical protein
MRLASKKRKSFFCRLTIIRVIFNEINLVFGFAKAAPKVCSLSFQYQALTAPGSM